MKHTCLLVAVVSALAVLPLAGCGDPPQPVESLSSSASQLPPGHPLPAGSVQPTADETKLAGTIALEGDKFDAPETTVFVNVRAKGQKAPWLSRKYTMQASQIAKSDAGARVLTFELRSADPQMETFNLNGMHDAPEGIELELHACVKSGGFVDVPTLCEVVAPFEKGKLDYALTLKMP
jgi:hypothetical protein